MPFGTFVTNTLKEWKLACPKSDGDLVFPNGAGKVESLANIINRGSYPAQGSQQARLSTVRQIHGHARATPLLCLLVHQPAGRWWPGPAAENCAGAARAFHITMTYDRYGHLFPRGDDTKELDAAERALLA